METTARKFFISYSHAEAEERALARWFHEALLRAGHQSFIDAGIPLGAKWSEEVERNLTACDCFIALLSEAAVKSEMVIEEVRRANSLRRQLIPVLVRFDGDFGYHLGAIINPLQWERWESKKDSEPILQKILHLAGGSATPQPVKQPAKRRAAKSPRKDTPPRPAPMAPPVPGGAIERADPFYIKRRIEKPLMELALKKGQTVTIEGPRQCGKSSLLQRYLAACEKANQQWALIDLSRFDEAGFQPYSALLTTVARALSRKLNLATDLSAGIADSLDFCFWIEDNILKRVSEPVVIGFDEVDRVFDYEYRHDFFTTLRSWHNDRAASKKTWGRLGLVMVISTERHLLVDNATLSPFNLGLHALLQPFDLKECLRLNARFEKLAGKSLSENDVGRLWELLRGQPYLTHEAIHAVATRRITSVKRLVETAADDDGPFADHLRSLLKRITLRGDYNLPIVFKQIIANDPPNDQQAIGRLKAAGLARIENKKPVPANQLYLRYFGRML